MHQFLEQLINNPPSKKRSQTQTNSQIVRQNSERQRMEQLIQLQRKDSQPGLYSSQQYQNAIIKQYNNCISQWTHSKQPHDESSECQVEEVTEQILFDDDGAQTMAQRLKELLPKVKESQPQLQASHKQQEQQVLEVYSPSEYKLQHFHTNVDNQFTKYQYNNHYNHASNRRYPTQPHESTQNLQQSPQMMKSEVFGTNFALRSIANSDERGSINIKTVEGLIIGINSARQSQIELAKWFQLQKQCFSQFINIIMAKIQVEIKKGLQKSQIYKRQQVKQSVIQQLEHSVRQQLKCSIRQQLQVEYQQRLKEEKLVLQSQPEQRHRNLDIRPSQISSGISRRSSLPPESGISSQRKWQIEKKLIKEELEQRYQYRLEKLEQQLEQQRKYSEQLIKTFQQTHKPSSIQSSLTGNGKNAPFELDEELTFVKKQLEDRDQTISELESEIQRLNEHVFDVEQKVEGIELEVENRLREKVKLLQAEHQKTLQQLKHTHNIPINSHNQPSPITQLNPILENSSHLEQSSHLFGRQSTHPSSPNNNLHQQLTQIQLQNQQLKKIIMELQQEKKSIELQLKQQDKIIMFREEQVKKNQQDIAYEWTEVQKERHATLNRQQELTIAEQNISRKISQIRTKQIDLDRWQTQLQKRQLALDLRQHQINQKLQQIVHQTNLHKQHELKSYKQRQLNNYKQNLNRNEKQSISNSSNQNKLSQQNIHEFNTQGGGGSFRPNGVNIPQLPIGKKYQDQQQIKQEKSFDHDYPYRNKPQQLVSKAYFEKSFEDPDRSYTRQNRSRQHMVITSNNFRSNRANHNTHQFVLPQTSKVQRNSCSKSRSKEKPMLRNNFVNGSSSISTTTYKNPSFKGKYIEEYYQNKQTTNLDGLGSKLERLRDEIKREIDSIK